MPGCSIIACGVRKNRKLPLLKLHRIPEKAELKFKWLEIIGVGNINPNHKTPFICSLHFEESDYNKNDGGRLQSGALPSPHLLPSNHVPQEDNSSNLAVEPDIEPDLGVRFAERKIIQKLCQRLKKKNLVIKRLKEKIRRQTIKIEGYNGKIKELEKKNLQTRNILKDCTSHDDFYKSLQKQIARAKSMPVTQ